MVLFNKQFLLNIVAPALLLCWAATIIYSAVAGDRGYQALSRLEAEVELKAAEVDALRERRMSLQRRANQLNSKSLDPDLIDEQIRSVLGYTRDGDIVIPRRVLDNALSQPKSE
ncbi:MAG: hypothetical protein DHS20C05_20470 [Hyphococcus sp.]|nr:MAG: hypothetical protein DHS20C05_20470 [Marinicaulis sp.]